jgi:hypothetical protein
MKKKKEIDENTLIYREVEKLLEDLDKLVVKRYDELPFGIIKAEDRYGENLEAARAIERQLNVLIEKTYLKR